MIFNEARIIKRFWLAVAGLSLFAVLGANAQVEAQDQTAAQIGQASVEPASTAANAGIESAEGNTAEDGATTAPPAEADGKAEKAKIGSSETEHNEDNYRRFMELKDQNRRSSDLPMNAYQPGMQKLDELPEESQKHLRNELRSVIVQEGEWQEGDENKQYAYVPSEAAKSSAELQQREADAWVELVDKYQEREAQIHANSARSDAASKAGDAAAGDSPSKGGQQGQSAQQSQNGQQGQQGQKGEQGGQTGESGQAGSQNQQQQSDAESAASSDSYSPAEAAAQQQAAGNQGVSENALQFLTQAQQQGQAGGQSQERSGNQAGAQAGQQQKAADSASQAGEQSQDSQSDQEKSEQSEESQPAEAASTESDSEQEESKQEDSDEAASEQASEAASEVEAESETESTEAEQAEESEESQSVEMPSPFTDSDQDAGTTQNAFEQLRGASQQEEAPADTLLIQDLINAQGVEVEVEASGQQPDPEQEPQADKNEDVPDKR